MSISFLTLLHFIHLLQELEQEAKGPPDLPNILRRIKDSEYTVPCLCCYSFLFFSTCIVMPLSSNSKLSHSWLHVVSSMAVVRVLSSFKALRPEGAVRADYVKQLAADLSSYYGYNDFLISTFLQVHPLFLLFIISASSSTPSVNRKLLLLKTVFLKET